MQCEVFKVMEPNGWISGNAIGVMLAAPAVSIDAAVSAGGYPVDPLADISCGWGEKPVPGLAPLPPCHAFDEDEDENVDVVDDDDDEEEEDDFDDDFDDLDDDYEPDDDDEDLIDDGDD